MKCQNEMAQSSKNLRKKPISNHTGVKFKPFKGQKNYSEASNEEGVGGSHVKEQDQTDNQTSQKQH